jgi:hypothetical protein
MQGGVSALPIPAFPTGIIRGRFHPVDGGLYLCGMYAWAGTQQESGGFFRVRYTGKPLFVPIGLTAKRRGLAITFSDSLDRARATDASRYAIKTWALRRSKRYGSDHIDEKRPHIIAAQLSDGGKTIFLEVSDMQPTWCMEIRYDLKGPDGELVQGSIDNTIHKLGD